MDDFTINPLYKEYYKNINIYSILIASIVNNAVQYFPFIKKYKIIFINEKCQTSLIIKLNNNNEKRLICYCKNKKIKDKFYLSFNDFKLLFNAASVVSLEAIDILNKVYLFITQNGREPFSIKTESKVNSNIKILKYKTLEYKKEDVLI